MSIPSDQPLLLLDYPSAAAALSMTRQALSDLVYKNRGPAIVKIGSRTFFTPDDLKAWISRQRMPANDHRPVMSAPAPQAAMQPAKRKRGRPTKAEQLARAAHFQHC
ncbi:helix-turn-helix transcriptional regulator [Dongia sp.]|uniref:helix-turn-helix transcriptional regulator n=1 Tax=Dongia sp. TaxID=1977262 RepID=UPI0035B45465